ncbi:MAG TPA: ATP-binding cassette domain-containing protein, partial [Stellaceae bacterium]|nr:ATP-binding cassette domain-containing protein [Stellaceae bacterium]
MSDILAVEQIRAAYQSGIDILQDLSLTVPEQSLTLVIGPNGAGKSTLLRAIFGFLKPHAGAIRFRGEAIEALEPSEIKSRGISYVPQEINTFPYLTVEENLRMGGWTFRRDKARLKHQVERVYEIFPALASRRRVRAGELSGGQGRMLSVAREIMTEPVLMLVDEPTAGL